MGESLPKLIADLSKSKLFAYFLILWGAAFFFSGLADLVWVAEGYLSGAELALEILESLAEIGCAAILAMLGLKILNRI